MGTGGEEAVFSAGARSGGLLWALLFLALLARQALRLKEPGRNRKAGWSALLAYGGIAVIQVSVALQRFSGGSPLVKVVPLVLCLAVFVVAMVLGVQALLEVGAQRRAGAVCEARGARAGVGLSALAVVGMGVALFSVLGAGGSVPTANPASARAPAIRDERLNFTFEPPEGWAPLDAKKLNPLASGVWIEPTRQIYFMIIAEEGVESDSEGAARTVEANLAAGTEKATVLERGPHVVGGLAGVRIASRGRKGAAELAFVHWVYGNNGYVYQLMTWAVVGQAEAVAHDAELLAGRFRILDPQRRPFSPPPPPERRWSFRSPAWRYRVELDRKSFSEWKGLKEEWPAADFGARCGDSCAIAVFALRLPSDPPSIDATARALFDMVHLKFPGEGYEGRRAVRVSPAEGFEVTHADRRKGEGWDWRLRVVSDGPRAWLVAGFSRGGAADLAALRDAGIEAVTFEAAPPEEQPPAPSTPKERHRQARALNEIGLHEYDLELFAQAATRFAQSSRLEPEDRVLLKNAADAHAKAGLFAEGLALVDAGRSRFRGDVALGAARALLASHAGREAEALQEYAALFGRGLGEEEHLERYAELLEGAGRRAEAIAAVASFRRRHDERDALLLQVALLERAGNPRAGSELLRGAFARKADPVVGYRWVAGMLDGGRKAEALREAVALVKRYPGNGAMYRLRGRCELALGRFAESKGSFERALEHDPTDSSSREHLDHVSAAMGEGQNSLLKEAIEEVAVPPGLLGAAPTGAPPDGFGAWYSERLVAYAFRKGKELRRTDLWRGRAVDAAGVERLGTFDLSFDPLSEQIFVNRVVVRDARGHEIARGKPGDWYVSDQATGSLGTTRRNLHVQVNGLRPGYDVEVVVTRRAGSPPDRMEFVEESLAATLPRLRSALVVTGEVDGVASFASPGVEIRRLKGAVAFVASGPWVFRAEPMRQDHQEWLPTVWIGPTGSSWVSEAQGYEAEIAGTDRPEKAVEVVAAAEAAGRTTPEARLFALARWVQRGITYRAIEFGRRAHVPHPLAEIVRSRFGDCKDHALLLKRLLEAQGVPARLALIRAGGPVRPELPSVDQFDHMIVYVPGVGGGTFLDATDKGAPPGPPPPALCGKQALVLDGPRSRLVALPEAPSGGIETERQVTVGEGELDVREKVRLTGPPAAGMRSFLAGTDPSSRVEALQSFLARDANGLRVTSLRIDALDEVEKPLTLEVRYLLRGRGRALGGEQALPTPAVWERAYLDAEPVPRRESPFEVSALNVKSVVELRPATGQRFASVPEPSPGKGSFARWERSAHRDGTGLRLEASLSRKAGRFPAQRWGEFVEEMAKAIATVEAPLAIRREGAPRSEAEGGATR